MKVSGEYTFDAPQGMVWEMLQDPEVLASVLPGCEQLDLIGENEYEGTLKIKIGPVQGKFKGKVKLENISAPDSYDMKVDGRGAPGFVNATGGLKLSAQGDQTVMVYDGEARVGGRIASVGQRLLDSSAKAIIRQSLEALNTILEAQVVASGSAAVADAIETAADVVAEDAADEVTAVSAAAPAPSTSPATPPRPAVKAPSQTEFAANVAKEVAKDLIPRPVLIGGGIVIVLLILYWLFSS